MNAKSVLEVFESPNLAKTLEEKKSGEKRGEKLKRVGTPEKKRKNMLEEEKEQGEKEKSSGKRRKVKKVKRRMRMNQSVMGAC
jgi:hypothetical protein